MAARRLIILLVVLLLISTIAAALAPTPAEREGTSTDTTAAPTDREADGGREDGSAGELLEVVVEVPAEPDPEAKEEEPKEPGGDGTQAAPERQRIEAAVGDQLALTVRSGETTEVEIPELGLLETAAEGGPARFDLLLREPGRLDVTAGGREVAEIVVEDDQRR